MILIQRDLPAEGLTAVEVQLQRGNVTLRTAADGAGGSLRASSPGYLSTDALEVETRDATLYVRQAHAMGHHDFPPIDVEISLPGSVRQVQCVTGLGDLRLEGVAADVHARTGKGDVFASDGRGRGLLETGHGEIRVARWEGPLSLHTGKGNVEAEAVRGELEVRTGKGDVRIGEALERVEVRSGKGNVIAGRLAGEALLHTGHGDVVATDLDGARLEVRTGHGQIALGGRLKSLTASTGHGDVVCRCDLVEGSFELNTSHGDVALHLPADADLRIDAVTSHGRVETNLPLVKVGRPGPESAFGRRFVGSIGSADPKATVRLRTSRGDIRIARSGDETGAAFAPSEHLTGSAAERAWHETLKAQESRLRKDAEDLAEELAEEEAERAEELAERMAEMGERIGEQVEESVEAALQGLQHAWRQPASTSRGPATIASQPEAPKAEKADEAGPRPEPAKDPEMAILEAVSRGELSVDEALALLGKLNAKRWGANPVE